MKQRATGAKGGKDKIPVCRRNCEWAQSAKMLQELRVESYTDLKLSLPFDSKSNGEPMKFLQ